MATWMATPGLALLGRRGPALPQDGVSRRRRSLAGTIEISLEPSVAQRHALNYWPRIPSANRTALAEPMQEIVSMLRDPAYHVHGRRAGAHPRARHAPGLAGVRALSHPGAVRCELAARRAGCERGPQHRVEGGRHLRPFSRTSIRCGRPAGATRVRERARHDAPRPPRARRRGAHASARSGHPPQRRPSGSSAARPPRSWRWSACAARRRSPDSEGATRPRLWCLCTISSTGSDQKKERWLPSVSTKTR